MLRNTVGNFLERDFGISAENIKEKKCNPETGFNEFELGLETV